MSAGSADSDDAGRVARAGPSSARRPLAGSEPWGDAGGGAGGGFALGFSLICASRWESVRPDRTSGGGAVGEDGLGRVFPALGAVTWRRFREGPHQELRPGALHAPRTRPGLGVGGSLSRLACGLNLWGEKTPDPATFHLPYIWVGSGISDYFF